MSDKANDSNNPLNIAVEHSGSPYSSSTDTSSGDIPNTNQQSTYTFSETELLSAVDATDAKNDALNVEGLTVQPDRGTVINNGDGSWTVWPDPGFSGVMQLSFMVNDGVDSSPAKVPLYVKAVREASMEGGFLEVKMDVDGTSTLTRKELLANVTGIDGDNLSVSNFQSANATVTDNGDGTFSIVSAAAFDGPADITFDVTDGTKTIQALIAVQLWTTART